MHTIFLFDIDGTIMLSGGAGYRAMNRVTESLFGKPFDWEGVEAGGNLDPLIYQQGAARNGIVDAHLHHDRFRDTYLPILEEELQRDPTRIVIMPGVTSLIERLQRRVIERGDLVLGLLTGNYGPAARIKLRTIGIDPEWFTLNAFGDEAPTRPDLVALALKRYQQRYGVAANAKRVVVIGDTPHDVACAKAHGCVAFAVGTGHYTASQLIEAGADISVNDLSDPASLLALLDRAE